MDHIPFELFKRRECGVALATQSLVAMQGLLVHINAQSVSVAHMRSTWWPLRFDDDFWYWVISFTWHNTSIHVFLKKKQWIKGNHGKSRKTGVAGQGKPDLGVGRYAIDIHTATLIVRSPRAKNMTFCVEFLCTKFWGRISGRKWPAKHESEIGFSIFRGKIGQIGRGISNANCIHCRPQAWVWYTQANGRHRRSRNIQTTPARVYSLAVACRGS